MAQLNFALNQEFLQVFFLVEKKLLENLWNVYLTSFFKQNLLKNYKPAPMRSTERTDYGNGIRPKIHYHPYW